MELKKKHKKTTPVHRYDLHLKPTWPMAHSESAVYTKLGK